MALNWWVTSSSAKQNLRLTKEGSKVETRLFFDDRGLDKYYGLLELGEQYGIFQRKSGIGYQICWGTLLFILRAVLANPEKYFTPEVMEKLEEAAKQEFSYGN